MSIVPLAGLFVASLGALCITMVGPLLTGPKRAAIASTIVVLMGVGVLLLWMGVSMPLRA